MAYTYEKYGQSLTGVDLYWYKFVPNGAPGQKFPAVIGLHPGGLHAGPALLKPQGDTFAANGYLFFGTEYRLAPPSQEMNTSEVVAGFNPGNHPPNGQNTVGDHGYAREMEDDVAMAVLAARSHPDCDGRVYGIGGSAGAFLVVMNICTRTEGDDAFDFGVSCSIGVFDFYQSEIWRIPAVGNVTIPHEALANYINIPDTFPDAPTGADLIAARDASASYHFNAAKLGGRWWGMLSDRDSPGIPTSHGYPTASYYKDGSLAVDEGTGIYTVTQGILPTAIAAGMTESTADVPEPGTLKYKHSLIEVSTQDIRHAHAFAYWGALMPDGSGRKVAEAVVEWFNGAAGQTGGTPTIEGFEPTEGFAGITEVVITGTNFNNVEGVRFNKIDALSFTVDSDTQITAIPAAGSTSGRITVRTATDTVNSDDAFTVADLPAPGEDPTSTRSPILNYPIAGYLAPPPTRPSPPTSLFAHTSGVPGTHKGEATWIPPSDTSGATLLNYRGWLTSDNGSSGTVPDIPGNAVKTDLLDLEVDTEYTFHLQAVTAYGESDEATYTFMSSPGSGPPDSKDQPRGCLFLFDSPPDENGKHHVDWHPAGFWGNPQLLGSRYRSSWDTICTNPLDPTDTTYRDWSDVDAYLDQCELYGQFAGISFAAGIYCPPWLLAMPGVKTIDQQGPDPGVMPIPWNEKFLDEWIGFIDEFAERYDERAGLLYFVVGGLGQVIETVVAQNEQDLTDLLADATLRGFGSISEAWLHAVNRILFACSQVFHRTHFLLSLAKIVPDSWLASGGDEGTNACYSAFDVGYEVSPTLFGAMNAGLNENSAYNPPSGFAPNIIIKDNSLNIACGFQFGHTSNADETVFNDTLINGGTELAGKFIELYKNDARGVTPAYPSGGDPAYVADIDAANDVMINTNP